VEKGASRKVWGRGYASWWSGEMIIGLGMRQGGGKCG